MARNANPLLRVLERLPLSVVVASPFTGEILWVNARNMDVVGATAPEQLIGRNILEFLEPSQYAVALRDLAAVTIGASPPPVLYRLKRLDGGTADVQISSVPFKYEGGPAMLSLVADVTQREEALRRFRETEGRFGGLVEALGDGIVVIVDDVVAYANPKAAEMLKREPAEMTGTIIYEHIVESQRARVREIRRTRVLRKQPYPPTRVSLLASDASTVDVIAHTSPARWDGTSADVTILHPIGELMIEAEEV